MKHIFYILLVVLAYGPVRAYAGKTGKTVSYLPVIGMKDQEVRKNGRSVELTMVVDLSGARIRTQHTVSLTPVLVSRDGRREAAFPPVVVDGGTRSKVYLRAPRLKSVELPPCHDGRAEVVIRRRNGTEQTYDYAAALPYERWMLDGRVELREEVHGCVNCASGESEQELMSDVLPGFVPEYRFAAILPEPEPVKARAETRTARLQFRQDSYTILPEFRNNRAELDTMSNSILLVKRNGDVEITGIYITGYASPEGSEAHNLVLSENRAKALAAAIKVHDSLWESGTLSYDMSQYEIARTYFQWLCDHCRYDNAAADDSASHLAYGALVSGLAVCDGYTGAYNLLLKLEGIECTSLFNDSHIWTLATLDGTQYHIDVTWGDQYGRTDLRYFGMSEEQSYQCHPWGTADKKK